MRLKFRLLLLAVTILTLVVRFTFPVTAQQSPTGSIKGTVTDQQGAVISDATVTVTNKATGDTRKTNTGDDGIYLVSTLPPGEYEVRIESPNFSTYLITVTVQVGLTVDGDATMRVGKPDEIVEVVSEASIINKEAHNVQGVINREKIDALPLNGRNFLQLALLEPGVGVSVSNAGDANNLFNVSIGGAPSSLTRITVDGGSVLDYVTGGAAQNFSTETIQEFQISTFNFDLSTGVTSVGAVNIVSRQGGNEFHGNAFAFWRDDAFAAVPTLIPSDLDFSRYQYGGSFGGPIKKDRAFFYTNVEWLDQEAAVATVPTGPFFQQFNNISTSPYDGVVFNARGDFRLSDQHNLFTRYSYDDNDAFAPVNTNTPPSYWRINANRSHNAQAGVTSTLTQTLVNDFRFNYQRIRNDSLLPEESDCPASNVGCLGRGGVQIRFVNSNLRLGNNENAPQQRILDRYQFSDNVNWQKGAHRIRFGGEWEHDYGKGFWAFAEPAVIVLYDPELVLLQNAGVSAAINGNPQIPAPLKPVLLNLLTIPLPAAFTTPGAPITINDILQLPIAGGVVGLGNPEQPPPFNQERARQSDRLRFYVQDSWLMRPGFTLNYGVSYLYETNLFNHDLPKPALLRPLLSSLEPSPKDKNNIAPSVGFAWDVKNDGKTVIRGGAGMFYDTALFVTRLRERATIGPAGNGRSQVASSFYRNTFSFPTSPVPLPPPLQALVSYINPPVGTSVDFQGSPTGVFATRFTGQNFLDLLNSQNPAILAQLQALGEQGITGVQLLKTGTDILDPDNVTPYSLQYTLGVQHQFAGNLALSADFVLRNRRHTLFQVDYNLFNRVAARGGPVIRPCTEAEQANPAALCSNGPLSTIQSGNRETYKALLVKLDKRFSNRFQFTASYALSSLRGFAPDRNLTDWFGQDIYLGADARHRFTFSGIVDLPWGFQASLISVLSSKGPFDARLSGIDLDGDGTENDTLPGLEINELNRGVDEDELREIVNQFNANFAGRPDARGEEIRPVFLPNNFEFGDNFQSHDLRISKRFRWAERYSLEAIAEVFNLFNNANLGGHSNRLDVGENIRDENGNVVGFRPPSSFDFGRPTTRAGQAFGTGGPRAFQFGARFQF